MMDHKTLQSDYPSFADAFYHCFSDLLLIDRMLYMTILEDLINRYSEKIRKHHNLSHIDYMLKHAKRIVYSLKNSDKHASSNIIEKNWKIFLLAIMYHDAIYDPIEGESNELRSAKYFALMMKRIADVYTNFMSEEDIFIVINLIEATADYDTHIESVKCSFPNTKMYTLLCALKDLDYLVMSEEKNIYDDYSEAIYNEFEPVFGAKLTNIGRLEFLKNLPDKLFIFMTSNTFNLDKIARTNIEKEIETLERITK